jgi:hypothetical protein
MLRTLTCLVRTPEALDAAHAALRALLAPLPGAPPLAEPLPAALPPGARHCALPLGPRLALELLHLPPTLLPFHWREGQQLHLVSARLCGSAEGALAPLLAQAAAARSRVAGALHGLGLLPAGLALPQLQLHLPAAAPAPAAGAQQQQQQQQQQPLAEGALKELVLGVPEGSALAAAEARLAAAATRARSSLAVWHTHCGTLPRLRLLPSAYSALILHAASLPEAAARHAEGGGGGGSGVRLELHGQRHGVEGVAGNGQLRVRGAALAGLDLRFCSSAGAAPGLFAEDEATLTDLMDPALNNIGAKKEALACKSIVGMDLVSTLRLRMSGRVG